MGVKSNAKYLYFYNAKLENLTKRCLIPLIKFMIIGTATDTGKALFYYYSSDMKIICTLGGLATILSIILHWVELLRIMQELYGAIMIIVYYVF